MAVHYFKTGTSSNCGLVDIVKIGHDALLVRWSKRKLPYGPYLGAESPVSRAVAPFWYGIE